MCDRRKPFPSDQDRKPCREARFEGEGHSGEDQPGQGWIGAHCGRRRGNRQEIRKPGPTHRKVGDPVIRIRHTLLKTGDR